MIPFSPPRIDQKILDEVNAALLSGWITTGPRTKLFEKRISEYTSAPNTLCLNSATAGLEIMLRWFGVKEGDEVILPAYTYSATANVIIHTGATPVFADVNRHDFNINCNEIEKLINEKTKVIMPVDFGGMPCDYDAMMSLVKKMTYLFKPNTKEQDMLGRIMVLSDAAHSFGALYKGKKTGTLADATVFSFHAVKNLTTAEGGAVCLNLPENFSNSDIYSELCIKTLHGQTKDALAKTQKGNWRYDIIEAGYKCNMTDLAAAIGLIELERYDADTLIKRKRIFQNYQNELIKNPYIELPIFETAEKCSSFHLYPIRIKGADEKKRDAIIQKIFDADVSVNVHFIPVPCMSFYKNMGYDIKNYPITYDNYSKEISLPVFYNLSDEDCLVVANAVNHAIKLVM
jgi:dTDP-4-amino-4,6-dideoxygalactose transaminase